ncbi:MAG: hypothetical protein RIB78_09495 [Gammaproteobacteria bacterium]
MLNMLDMLKTGFIIFTFAITSPVYADTDLDHGSEVKADAIRNADKNSDAALEETVKNTRTSAKQTLTDLDHGSEVKADAIRDADKKSDAALEKTIKNTSSAAN